MVKKEMIAMLLAGGRGSRLGVLTRNEAKPAVSFGGKYRIIDFSLSNCINSGVDTVGVLTPANPLRLNSHIGIGIPWDLDRNSGGVTILPPYEKSGDGRETGTANALFQNLEYMESYNPEYVLIISADHIYKMDYGIMLESHKSNGADITAAAIPVSEDGTPGSSPVSMGIYIFTWDVLKKALLALADDSACDLEKDVISYCKDNGASICTYEYNDYWRDVATLKSYWEANMELIDIIPEFNLYEDYWNIYTKSDSSLPQFVSPDAKIVRCLVGDASEVYGEVTNSLIGPGVVIGKGAIVRDSIIMQGCTICNGAVVDKAIIAENVMVGDGAKVGYGDYAESLYDPEIYNSDLAVIGEDSVIPAGVTVGRNTAICGETDTSDYPGGVLASGGYIIKDGGRV